MHDTVLYDMADHNPIPYLLPLVMLYLIIVVAAIHAAQHRRLFRLIFAPGGGGWMCFLGIGLLVTVIASYQIVLSSLYLHQLSQGRYQVVEGAVAEFIPEPIAGHVVGRFTVRGIMFTYTTDEMAAALQQPKPPLQPLQNNMYVRVFYTYDYRKVGVSASKSYAYQILRLELLQLSEPPPLKQATDGRFSLTATSQQPNPRMQADRLRRARSCLL
jgi:hypothetical protein